MVSPKNIRLWEAIATFVGTVMGAGILGVPYVVAESGLWTGIFVIVFLGIISMIMYLYLGEVILRTNGFHQLTGYAYRYLGRWGKNFMTFSMIIGIYGAMIAYLIGEGQTLSVLFGMNGDVIFSILGIGIKADLIFMLIFFIIVSSIIYSGLEAVGGSELLMLPLMLFVVLLISIFSVFYIDAGNLQGFSINRMLIPYGVTLFAYLGATSVPEMEQVLFRDRKRMKKALMIGIAIPLVIYLFFAFIVVGVTGKATTEVATIGLGKVIGEKMMIFGNVFAVFAMATSFLALGLALQQMYNFDYKLSKNKSWLLTCVIPLMIALSGFTSFIGIIGLGGVVAGGIDYIIIILMAHKAKKHGERKPEYEIPVNWISSILLVSLFLIGAGYYFWTLLI